ncbi:MAG: PepSY-associated TM helix domain-containing protein, partial [Bryobacteraceae bacterium]
RPDDYPYVDVTKWYPGDDSRGRTIVTINAYTGEVARVQDSRHEPGGTAALNLNRSLHFGQVYGMPTQVIAALGSFSVLFQTFSGLAIWWIRYRKTRRVKAKAKLGAKVEQPDLVEADI